MMDILLKLLFTFFKIGLFSFGGGYAMIPFMQREIIEKHQWLSSSEFVGITVISFILVSIASKAIDKFKESKYLKAALLGMRPVLIALIINAFISLAKDAYVDVKSIIVTLIVGGCLFSKKIHPIVIIVLAGLLGIIFWGII